MSESSHNSSQIMGILRWWSSLEIPNSKQKMFLKKAFSPDELKHALKDFSFERESYLHNPPINDEGVLDALIDLGRDPLLAPKLDEIALSVNELSRITIGIMSINHFFKNNNSSPKKDFKSMTRKACPYCHKYFSGSSAVRCHVRKFHETDKGFMCGYCGEVFGKIGQLRAHEARHDDQESEQFVEISSSPGGKTCKECGKTFSRRLRLREHYHRMHTKDALKMKCPYDDCGTTFYSKWLLDKHVNVVHFKLKAHECPECGLRFGYKHHVKNHLRTIHAQE